eukprot:3005081-Pleurochrysis_carterae.AAC.1
MQRSRDVNSTCGRALRARVTISGAPPPPCAQACAPDARGCARRRRAAARVHEAASTLYASAPVARLARAFPSHPCVRASARCPRSRRPAPSATLAVVHASL